MGRESSLNGLAKRNQSVIRYLREHEEELVKFSLSNNHVFKSLTELANDISLLNLYLENANKLVELKVEEIKFVEYVVNDGYYCEFYPINKNKLKYIYKCYTDGKVYPRLTEEQATNFDWCHTGYNQVPFTITNELEPSFVLKIKNNENLHQYSSIEIMNFGFDGSKLPTEEEIQSYEIPKKLIKK